MAENVTATVKDCVLYINLAGRVDSANAPSVEEKINAICSDKQSVNVVIDAENLEYISSAGLRIILRLRKNYPELKMINVNSEVYDILDMTGFTEMMTIEKAYRKLSVEGCEVIGRGSNGEVYRLDPDTIIKVYLNPDCLPDIHRERELARKAFVLGIPTAIPYDVVKVGDSYGSVFELLNAKSFTKILAADSSKIDEVVEMYVDLLKKIHSTEVQPGDMPDMKQVAIGWVRDIKGIISDAKWEKLNSLVNAIPDNHHMIHGDYHTKNVMVQNGEVLLIDMDTLSYGDPIFEFGSIFNAYKGFYFGKLPLDGVSFIGIPYEMGVEIWEKTLHLYFNTDDEEYLDTVRDKSALLGYTRVLRRTIRRCDTSRPDIKKMIDGYVNEIESILDRVDTLTL
ncbi:MAG: anti-sigma factor antagonist [Clostridia bacterium]|nr:anti-sigma factor antagonist [Clostridia bacterium]